MLINNPHVGMLGCFAALIGLCAVTAPAYGQCEPIEIQEISASDSTFLMINGPTIGSRTTRKSARLSRVVGWLEAAAN